MSTHNSSKKPWNKGKLVGQKLPIKLKEIWAVRVRLQLAGNIRDLALFNLAIDSKLRACDLVKLTVSDISRSGIVDSRATILQQKTGRPVQFEITEQTRDTISEWIKSVSLSGSDFLFRVGLKHPSISQLVSMRGSLKDGYRVSGWMRIATGLIH